MADKTTVEKGDYMSFGIRNYGLSGMPQWYDHNERVLKGDIVGITDKNTSITKNCIVKVNQTGCKDFDDSTDQLKHRARHINYWKAELERAIKDIDAEIQVLEAQRQQLKNASDTLKIPEYITEECIELRTLRMQSDLVYDEPQEALFSEAALIENVKKIHTDMLRDIEYQLNVNIAAKTALSEGQSDVPSWENYTVNALEQFKNAIERSKNLRAKVEATLINTARDLRSQDIKVNKALSERIARTEQVKVDLEKQLTVILTKISETENTLITLHEEMLKVSQRIQVAQTRLNTKSRRPDYENCREGSLQSLIDEVRDLNNCMSLLQKRSLETEKVRADLIHERAMLENEIIVKKKTLHIDNERCLFLRSHYQSAEKMSGY
ncbi:tektin family domain-containing protein [Phthorimaea operculella]|nr:tektin family domain-containing protein [Phthorimaea operculella]